MLKRCLAILMLVGVCVCENAYAQSIVWDNNLGGVFDDPGNWVGGVAPGTNDIAEFNLLGPYTVDFAGTTETAQLDVLGASVTFDMAGNSYFVGGTTTIDESVASFGAIGTRSLEVLDGDLTTAQVRVGDLLGNAELLIGSGGSVDVQGPQGQFNVGANNNIGANSVTVLDGGTLSVDQTLLIGGVTGQSAGSGTVSVTGNGSTLTAFSFVVVGGAGSGVLNLDDGAILSSIPNNVPGNSTTGIIAVETGSTGTVNVSQAAAWLDSNSIDVGRNGNGALNISSAGMVSSPTSSVARFPGSTGNVSIDGSNSSWNITGDLIIGGTFVIVGGVGTVDVTNGGRLEASGNIRVRTGSELRGDATIEAVNVNLDAGARLSGTPTVQGSVSNSGIVTPGQLTGIINIFGDYSQNPDGLLEIEVEGLQPGLEHDQLVIGGNATLAGRLDVPVTSAPGFPVAGDEITILQTFGTVGVLGQFNVITSPNIAAQAPGLALRANYFPDQVRLEFVAPTTNVFQGSPSGNSDWFAPVGVWSDGAPDSTSSVQLSSNIPPFIPQNVTIAGPQNAVVHDITVSGELQPMTLSVGGDNTLFANSNVAVGNNGVVSLTEGGTVTSPNVQVNTGGLLTGNGTINGNTVIGSGTGVGAAILSPGNSVGAITQNGDLQIQCDGVVEIELVQDNSSPGGPVHDRITVSGEVEYGGTLALDLSNAVVSPPSETNRPTFDIITAGTRSADTVFDEVILMGVPAGLGVQVLYFDEQTAPIEGNLLDGPIAAMGGGPPATASAVLGFLGDMNLDGTVTEDDIPEFVLGLTDPDKYSEVVEDINMDAGYSPAAMGNTNGDDTFDFDDVDSFVTIVEAISSELTAAEIYEMIAEALADTVGTDSISSDLSAFHVASSHAAGLSGCGGLEVPEPATAWLLLLGMVAMSKRQLRPRCFVNG